MGERKRRKTAFLLAHPRCCFCGGSRAATTEDHVPARSIFDGRRWPEGYSFPACNFCNDVTRQDENVLAFLSRIRTENDGSETEQQRAETRRYLAAMQYAYPDAYRSMRMSANDVPRFLRDKGFPRQPNTFLHDIPVLSVGRSEFIRPIKNFGIKLFCALDYKHAGRIVPSDALIALRIVTNVQLSSGVLSDEIFRMLSGRPTLKRARTQLDEQFSYIYAVAVEQTTSAYVCKFRGSFVIIGMVTTTPLPKEFDEDPEMGAFLGGPFSPNRDKAAGCGG